MIHIFPPRAPITHVPCVQCSLLPGESKDVDILWAPEIMGNTNVQYGTIMKVFLFFRKKKKKFILCFYRLKWFQEPLSCRKMDQTTSGKSPAVLQVLLLHTKQHKMSNTSMCHNVPSPLKKVNFQCAGVMVVKSNTPYIKQISTLFLHEYSLNFHVLLAYHICKYYFMAVPVLSLM